MKKRPRSVEFTPQEKKALSAYERWELPALLDSEIEAQRKAELEQRRQEIIDELNLPTAEEFEQIRKEAYEDGFKEGKKEGLSRGHQQGLKNGQAEIDAVLARMTQVMHALSQPIPAQDHRIEETLMHFVLEFCKNIIGRELIADSQVIGEVLEEIIKIVNLEQKIKVFLNPQDADLILQVLENKALLDDNWQIIHRDTVTPGGCIVDTSESHIEASVEKRIADLTNDIYQNLLEVELESKEDLFSELQGYQNSAQNDELSSQAESPAVKESTSTLNNPVTKDGDDQVTEETDLSLFESDLTSTLEDFHESESEASNEELGQEDETSIKKDSGEPMQPGSSPG